MGIKLNYNNLIIGSNSQLSFYFSEETERISSREINFEKLKKTRYKNIYLLFAEQRTFLNENEKFFSSINVDYTIDVINKIKDYADNIIVFATSELWNMYDGPISLNMPFKYDYSPYIKSKEILVNTLKEKNNFFQNVKIIYPFNFNSPYRKSGFLFQKIFNSITKKEKVEVGNLNVSRDIIHPKKIVENIQSLENDIIIGSGELINIEVFYKKLYENFNLNFDDFVFVNENLTFNKRNEYFSSIKYSNINELIYSTTNDIKNYLVSKRHD